MVMHPSSKPSTLHLVIHGRVQGVFFRDSMRREAQRLAISGWVRNRSDGRWKPWCRASPRVDAIVRWAQRGPEQAQVSALTSGRAGRLHRFEIID